MQMVVPWKIGRMEHWFDLETRERRVYLEDVSEGACSNREEQFSGFGAAAAGIKMLCLQDQ